MSGKVIVLHSNDVHGEIAGYARIAKLKKDYYAQGADIVIALAHLCVDA